MLAEQRRGPVDGAGRRGELHRRADRVHPADGRMVQFHHHVAGERVRVGEHLTMVHHRACRHAHLLEFGQPFVARPGLHHGLEDLDQLVIVRHPVGAGPEARVLRQVGPAEHVADAEPEVLLRAADREIAVLRLEDLVGRAAAVALADPLRRLPGREIGRRLIDAERHGALVERDIDMLALAGAGAAVDGDHGGVGPEHAGADIGYGDGQAEGRAVLRTVDGGEAGHGLGNQVEAAAGAVGPVLPEARDRGHHQAGILRRERIVAEAEPRHDAGPEVLDHDIGRDAEVPRGLEAVLALQVERHGALVAVPEHEGRALALHEGRRLAHRFAFGTLHLDDIGALVGEQHRAIGSRKIGGKVDDSKPFQCPGHGALASHEISAAILAKRFLLARAAPARHNRRGRQGETGSMDEIRLRRQGQVAVVTINRPQKKNCCTKAMWFELGRLFGELDKDGDVRAIVLTGAGENFCTGADISEFAEVRGDADQAADYARAVLAAEHGIAEVSKPVIAAIRGYAVGGGCGLIVCADFRVSDRSGRFGVPAARLSIVYGMDGLQKLASIVGVTNAKKIMYTAKRFTAEEAADMGLVDMLVDGDPVEAAIEFADSMAGNAPLSIMGHKIGLNAVAAGRMAETEDSYRDLQMQASESEDYREGRTAFMEKRTPVFQGR